MFFFIIQSIYFLVVLLLLLLIGHKVVDKFSLSKSGKIIYGFMYSIAILGVISLPFVYLHTKFIGSSIIVLLIFVFILYKHLGFNFIGSIDILKEELNLSNYVYLFISFILGLVALPAADSYTYTPLILGSISNNQIFSSNGLAYTTDIGSHAMDTFYYILSIITWLAPGDDYLFVVTFFSVLACFLLFKSYDIILDNLNIRRRYSIVIFWLVVFCSVELFTPYYPRNELVYLLFAIVFSGTYLLVSIVPAIVFDLLSNYPKIDKSIIVLFTGFLLSISSSSYFLVPIFIFVLIISTQDSVVVSKLKFVLMWYFTYILLFVSATSDYKFSWLLLIGAVNVLIYRRQISYSFILKTCRMIKYIVIIGLILTIVFYSNIFVLLSNDPSVYFGHRSAYYNQLYLYPFGLLIVLVGYLKFDNNLVKKFSKYILLLFCTGFSYILFARLLVPGVAAIFHRVIVLALVPIYSIFIVSDILRTAKIQFKYVLLLVLFLSIGSDSLGNFRSRFITIENPQSFYEYKTQSTIAYDVANYPFESNSYLDIEQPENKRGYLGLFSIFQLNQSINYSPDIYDPYPVLGVEKTCNENCYLLAPLYEVANGEIVAEYEGYNLWKIK